MINSSFTIIMFSHVINFFNADYLVLGAKVNWTDYKNASCPWKSSHCIYNL